MTHYLKLVLALLFSMSFAFISTQAIAKGIYQKPDEFIANAFKTQSPDPEVIWIKGELRTKIEGILQHKYKEKRTRYWKKENRTVWILDEIGKKKPITVGIIIDNNKITQLKVLVFRETRGWEVRYPFFTQQFNTLSLKQDHTLSQTIDGISGATLSVRALDKLARISLILNSMVQ